MDKVFKYHFNKYSELKAVKNKAEEFAGKYINATLNFPGLQEQFLKKGEEPHKSYSFSTYLEFSELAVSAIQKHDQQEGKRRLIETYDKHIIYSYIKTFHTIHQMSKYSLIERREELLQPNLTKGDLSDISMSTERLELLKTSFNSLSPQKEGLNGNKDQYSFIGDFIKDAEKFFKEASAQKGNLLNRSAQKLFERRNANKIRPIIKLRNEILLDLNYSFETSCVLLKNAAEQGNLMKAYKNGEFKTAQDVEDFSSQFKDLNRLSIHNLAHNIEAVKKNIGNMNDRASLNLTEEEAIQNNHKIQSWLQYSNPLIHQAASCLLSRT